MIPLGYVGVLAETPRLSPTLRLSGGRLGSGGDGLAPEWFARIGNSAISANPPPSTALGSK